MPAMVRYSKGRPKLLAPIMLGLLLVSAALAWWLVEARSGQHDEAVDILEQMRAGGLAEYADALPGRRYMIRHADDRPVGWRIDVRAGGDDGVGGRTVTRLDDGTVVHVRWALSAGATEGTYIAERDGPEGNLVTHIKLDGDKVSVQEQSGRALRVAEAQTPVNYLPEGGLGFVIRAVARRQTTATFAGTIDGHAVARGQVRFVSLVVTADGPQRVEVTYAGQFSRVYSLDEAGRVRTIESPDGLTFRRVERAELIEAFPEAARLVPQNGGDDAAAGATTPTAEGGA